MARTVRSLIDMLTGSGQDAAEVCRFYAETKQYLIRFANENNSQFINEKTISLPSLSLNEFGNQDGLWAFNFGGIIEKMFRNEMKNKKVQEKLSLIRNQLYSIAEVIENPELEKMYYKA